MAAQKEDDEVMRRALAQETGNASSASTEKVPDMEPMKMQHKQVKLRRILVNGVECGCGETLHICGSQFEVTLQMQVVSMEQPVPPARQAAVLVGLLQPNLGRERQSAKGSPEGEAAGSAEGQPDGAEKGNKKGAVTNEAEIMGYDGFDEGKGKGSRSSTEGRRGSPLVR